MESGGDVWPDLRKVCRYLQKNRRPGIYAREAPVQISTKFIEENKEILDLLLQQVFPALPSRRNGESFEDRCGFRSDEPCVRFKALASVPLCRLPITNRRRKTIQAAAPDTGSPYLARSMPNFFMR